MANKAVGWAWDQETDRPIDKSILVALADFAGPDGYSYPSHRQIGEMVQCSADSVQRAVKRLIVRGLIRVENREREGNKGQGSNGYIVLYLGAESDKYRKLDNEIAVDRDGKLRPLPQNAAPPLPQNAAPPLPQNAAPPLPHFAVGGTATVRHPLPQLCGTMNPSLDPSLEEDARAGACEAGASPARASEHPHRTWQPGQPAIVRRGEPSWAHWLQHIADRELSIRAEAAGAIEVTAPWPGRDSRLIRIIDPADGGAS